MDEKRYSKQSFDKFLDFISRKGLVKAATVGNWQRAANNLLSVADESIVADVRKTDLNIIATQYANLKDATPGSIQTYKSRLKTALAEFLSYVDNPVSYRPKLVERNRAKSNNIGKTTTNTDNERGGDRGDAQPGGGEDSVSCLIFPIPIRADVVVKIYNLPHDLSRDEADKISNVIKALAPDQ